MKKIERNNIILNEQNILMKKKYKKSKRMNQKN